MPPMMHDSNLGAQILWRIIFDREHAASAPSVDAEELVIDSPALRRLIEEVRAEDIGVPRSYNRTFKPP